MADIFSDILGFAGRALNQAFTGDNLKDYKHASKLFVADQYRLMPKYGFLFHVAFDINRDAALPDPKNPNRDTEIGMLVKNIALPKFNLDVKKYNAYNRPNFVQTKINYETINISFHDDSADVIRNFWFDYYNYYYRDSDYSGGDSDSTGTYRIPHKYQPTRPTTKWGYTPRNVGTGPYLNAIRIYSLHQKRFSEYILINPIIRSFKHGEHSHGSSDTMSHEMAIDFEAVLYYYGSVSKDTVNGFINLHYDTSPSPLTPAGGGTRSILGPGGVMDTADDVLHDLAKGNYGSAIFKAGRGLQNIKNMDLRKAAVGELLGIGTNVLRGNNGGSGIFVPSLGDMGSNLGKIGSNFGLTGLVGGIGGSTGSSGGGWLAGGLGLGIAALTGTTRSQEITAASASVEGFPETPYNDLPSPTDEDVMAVINSENKLAEAASGEAKINNQDEQNVASNQGTQDATAQRQDLEQSLDVNKRQLNNAHAALGDAQNEADQAADVYQHFNDRYQERLAAGEDPESFRMRNLKRIVDEQSQRVATASDNLTAAQQKMDAAKSKRDELHTAYNNLG